MKPKLLAILTSILLLCAMLPLGAVSVSAEQATIAMPDVTGEPGDLITVPILLKNNPGLCSAKVWVGYDAAALELVSYEIGDFYEDGYSWSVIDRNPFCVAYVDVSQDYRYEQLATLTFKVKDDADLGVYPLTLTYNNGIDFFNRNWEPVYFDADEGSVTVVGDMSCQHEYDSLCDPDCNLCGTVREVEDHIYTDMYDTSCDICGVVRNVAQPSDLYADTVEHSVMDTDNGNGLAFRFELAANGVKMVNRTEADLTDATINYLGTDCKLLGMGAVITNDEAVGSSKFTLADVNGGTVIDIPAVYLQEANEDSCAFATRVIDIPDTQLERTVYARPYYVVEVDGEVIVVYGDVDTASCAEYM